MAKKKTFLSALREMVGPAKSKARRKPGKKRRRPKKLGAPVNPVTQFLAPTLDMDILINPPKDRRPRPCPTELTRGLVLTSRRHDIKCILLEPLENVDRETLKNVCARRLKEDKAIYLPTGTQVLKEETLHQGRTFIAKLRKGTLFLSPGGHPNGYLLANLQVPLRRELGSVPQFLSVTEQTAKRYLQSLVDIPQSFNLIKEDSFYDLEADSRRVEKGSLIISRSGVMTGLLLDSLQLPIQGKLADVKPLFHLHSNYKRYPLETLMQRAVNARGSEIAIERGAFLFSPRGKVYFVWKEGVSADEQKLKSWSISGNLNQEQGILEVSLQVRNDIGGPGNVITQEEINYLRDVFRQAGTTNILKGTLLLDRNVFYKFLIDMPYAQSGKFRTYLLSGGVVQLNTFRKGNTFSVDMGGKGLEITDLDLKLVREHLQPDGRILIKIGSNLRISDERQGDWVYAVTTNLFYPYDNFTRSYMEEFIPDNVRFDHREPKVSTLIGPQPPDEAKEEDIGAAGEPLADLLVLINNELHKDPPRVVLSRTAPSSTGAAASTGLMKSSPSVHRIGVISGLPTGTWRHASRSGRSIPSSKRPPKKEKRKSPSSRKTKTWTISPSTRQPCAERQRRVTDPPAGLSSAADKSQAASTR